MSKLEGSETGVPLIALLEIVGDFSAEFLAEVSVPFEFLVFKDGDDPTADIVLTSVGVLKLSQ